MSQGAYIAVVGGGVTGLAVALGAARAGWPVRVFEAASEPSDGALVLESYAEGALAALGVRFDQIPEAVPLSGAEITLSRGPRLFRADHDTRSARLGHHTIGTRRRVVCALLESAIPPEVRVERGARVVGVKEEGGAVQLTLADGRRASAALVIGCDGVASTVRARTLADGPPPEAEVTWWHGLVPEADAFVPESERRLVRSIWGPRARALRAPAGGGWWNWAVIVPDRKGRDRAAPLGRLRREVQGWDPALDALLAHATPERTAWKPHAHRSQLDTWGRGRVSLAGSAAHPTPPSLLQGDSLALEDAAVLARELRRGTDPVAALRAYERVRLPRVRWFTVQALKMQAAAAQGGADPEVLRERVAAILPRDGDDAEMKRLFDSQV